MSQQQQIMINEVEEEAEASENNTNTRAMTPQCAAAIRKDRRKAAKKERRKRKRKEMAEMARLEEEEARINGLEEQLRLQAEEEQERLRFEKELREFEERERKIMEEWERKKAQEQREEEERRRKSEEEEERAKQNQVGDENEVDEDGWEYVVEGPPEIIWQGNEIIVKKKKVRVKKQDAGQQITEDPNRPTSNPLPPQSEVFADYKNTSNLSAQQLLQNVAHETPNFGTEQDKAHCPFHLKTGACRFGSRCSRIHFYPDKSCTLLIKNMYNGPGLAWEQDEGLESTDEEVVLAYEEFYEDVHTEFLKFGEIVNFKVCRNGSSHLRGNVYVHFKSLDSAVLAYQSVNGRYYAGKQVQCEFVGVTKWKVAICGEFMKSKLQACSRGMTCNFIHCFRNPGGDYEWADWDKPPPRYWLEKMAALFGYSDESGYDKLTERESPRSLRNSTRNPMDDADRYHSRRSQSREVDYARHSRNYYVDDVRSSSRRMRHRTADRKHPEFLDDKQYDDTLNFREKAHIKNVSVDMDSDMERLDRERDRHSSSRNYPRSRRKRELKSRGKRSDRIHEDDSDVAQKTYNGDYSDDERKSSHFHTEQSPKSDGSEEFEDERSKRHSAQKLKRSRTRDHVDSRNGAADHDSEDPSDCGRSYRCSDSSSRHLSRKDTRKSEWGETEEQFRDHLKKSERKRENDKRWGSESRHERKRSRVSDCQIDEATDVRDRWEPDKGDSAEEKESNNRDCGA